MATRPDPDPDIHVLPVDDMREHVDSRECWCGPTIHYDRSGMGDMAVPLTALPAVVIHHSLDGRELVEQHGVN